MKIPEMKSGYNMKIERYDLNNIYSLDGKNKGLIICYLLATSLDVVVDFVMMESELGENEAPKAFYRKYTGEEFLKSFRTLEDFLQGYDREDFGEWQLRLGYKDVSVYIMGNREDTKVECVYSQKFDVNLVPLLMDIEKASYKVAAGSNPLIDKLKREYQMTDKRAMLTLHKLRSQKDIYKEFLRVFAEGFFPDDDDAVNVEGFTAERLTRDYPLNAVGAYNYLIYLRENPEKALSDLRAGLPNK